MAGPAEVLRAFVAAYRSGDESRMRSLLAPGIVAYVTNADAGADLVVGPDAYIERLPDLTGADIDLDITQSIDVAADQTLAMVQVRAHRKGRDLHNYAAFLARVVEGQIAELWMVDAQPAYSDEFWA
jgi:ketosteroid isomerase-like protein